MTIEQMKQSREAGVPEYNWVPPEWRDPNGAPPKLKDTIETEPPLSTSKLVCNRMAEQQPGEEKPVEPKPGEESKFKHGFSKWVHPSSDFSHDDPPLWNDEDLKRARETLGKDAPDQFKKLKKLVGRESLGMQRLGAVFEWVLCRANEHLGAINEALGYGLKKSTPNYAEYKKAREAYIAYLKDLDDHEPFLKQLPVVPGESGKSGYGRAVKWAYIFPLILSGQIVGAKVSIQWNPHSSSNGIPIPHS